MHDAAISSALEPAPHSKRGLISRLSFGPGLLFALSMLGPGSLVENVTIGASSGYALLWVLVLVLSFRWIWLNLSAKYVLVTGETLLLGYGRYGRWIPWLVFASLIVQRHLSNLYKIVLMGVAADMLLPMPIRSSSTVWSLVFAGAGLFLMTRQVKTLERWFRPVIAALGGALVLAAILSHPSAPGILHGIFVPSLAGGHGPYSSLLLITALVGSEAGALTNLSVFLFCIEKGLAGRVVPGASALRPAVQCGLYLFGGCSASDRCRRHPAAGKPGAAKRGTPGRRLLLDARHRWPAYLCVWTLGRLLFRLCRRN